MLVGKHRQRERSSNSSSECHMQVVGLGFRRRTDSSLDDGVGKRRVCVQGLYEKCVIGMGMERGACMP